MTISIIAAVARNRAIGKDNDLIWYLPKDLVFFKNKTSGHHVIMGRRNYESIPEKYRPLPGRPNIVVSRQGDYQAPGCSMVKTVEEGIELARREGEKEAFIIGGGEIYKYALENNLADKMYITWVHEDFNGDTFFPDFDRELWTETERIENEADSRNKIPFDFVTYTLNPNKN